MEPIHITCVMPLTINPFFDKIKLLDNEILKIEKITINKRDITYSVSNLFNSDDINYVTNIKNINKQINNLSNDDIELSLAWKKHIYHNQLPLNENETYIWNKLYSDYYNEHNRVLQIKTKFVDNYIDASKLKNAHLNLNCRKRINTTSKCDIKNFLILINNKNKTQNYTINSIKNEYDNILCKHNMNHIKYNDSHIECCFIINKIINLFDDYLQMIRYCLKLLKTNSYVIRESQTFLFNIEPVNSYFYDDNDDSIYINHMDTINNVSVENNNTIVKGNFVKFLKRPKGNDVYFEK